MSSCVKYDDLVLYDCCRKNVKEVFFYKFEDGFVLFVIDIIYGLILNCGNFIQFNIISEIGGLILFQVICMIMSIGIGGLMILNLVFVSLINVFKCGKYMYYWYMCFVDYKNSCYMMIQLKSLYCYNVFKFEDRR